MKESFSKREGFNTGRAAEITIRFEAPDWLRERVLDLAYQARFKPSELRTWLCHELLKAENKSNWTEFPNIAHEVERLLAAAEWYVVYDLIEWIYEETPDSEPAHRFRQGVNDLFFRGGVGWQMEGGDG